MMLSPSVRGVVAQMQRTRDGTTYRRHRAAIRRAVALEPTKRTLEAVLLIEMTERSGLTRCLEWALHRLMPLVGLPRTLRPRTVGPFQLTDAPFTFETTVLRVAELLRGANTDEEVARCWYGSAKRQPGSCVSYPEALQLARLVLREGSRQS